MKIVDIALQWPHLNAQIFIYFQWCANEHKLIIMELEIYFVNV
jgi:hypothetical protein